MHTPDMFNDYFDSAFGSTSVMAILRGFSPTRTTELAMRAWELGITQVEVPIETPDAVPSLEAAVAAAARQDRGIGAGTVTTPEQVHIARESGAVFTVAPGYDRDVIDESLDAGLPHLPGVSTPSEISHARRCGLNWVKVFPASQLGQSWLTMVAGPFPQLNMVVTGGMDAGNARAYLDAGARVVAVGSALSDPAQLPRLAELLSCPTTS